MTRSIHEWTPRNGLSYKENLNTIIRNNVGKFHKLKASEYLKLNAQDQKHFSYTIQVNR